MNARPLFLFAAIGLGYLIAIVVADFPTYPVFVGGLAFVAMMLAGVQHKALFMAMISAALLGYHFAVELVDFPLWPIQAFAVGCVLVGVLSITRNRIASQGGTQT